MSILQALFFFIIIIISLFLLVSGSAADCDYGIPWAFNI